MPKSFKNAHLKRFHREPVRVKPEESEKIELTEQPQLEEVAFVNPMAEFFDDMHVIQQQSRDPNLKRPAFDIGGPVFTNYLNWLILSEIMKLNKKMDKLLKKNG